MGGEGATFLGPAECLEPQVLIQPLSRSWIPMWTQETGLDA